MACRGVFFALTESERNKLFEADGDDAVVDLIQEEIEERWDEEWVCEVDKSWDAMHRCLSDGTLATDGSPRASLFFGGRQFHQGEDYIVSFLDSIRVRVAVDAIAEVDEGWFQSRYDTLDAHGYDGPQSVEDFEYTWGYFVAVRAFLQKAADAERPVIFTVDQ